MRILIGLALLAVVAWTTIDAYVYGDMKRFARWYP